MKHGRNNFYESDIDQAYADGCEDGYDNGYDAARERFCCVDSDEELALRLRCCEMATVHGRRDAVALIAEILRGVELNETANVLENMME